MFCILAVFVPSFFMVGVGRQLFVPLSLAVGFAMIASYLLSSTLVPVFSTWLMREAHRGEDRRLGCRAIVRPLSATASCASAGRWWSSISRLRRCCFCAAAAAAWAPRFFPDAMLRQFQLRLRAPTGTRIEETERIVLQALDVIQQRGRPGQRRDHHATSSACSRQLSRQH